MNTTVGTTEAAKTKPRSAALPPSPSTAKVRAILDIAEPSRDVT